jgi:hypothetical protein
MTRLSAWGMKMRRDPNLGLPCISIRLLSRWESATNESRASAAALTIRSFGELIPCANLASFLSVLRACFMFYARQTTNRDAGR